MQGFYHFIGIFTSVSLLSLWKVKKGDYSLH